MKQMSKKIRVKIYNYIMHHWTAPTALFTYSAFNFVLFINIHSHID